MIYSYKVLTEQLLDVRNNFTDFSLSQYLGDWSEDNVAKFSKLMNKCQQREKQMMK